MQVGFANKKLQELYEEGKCRKYKLPKGILKKFSMRVQQLEAAQDIYDLWETSSLNFEKLEGHENKYSVRVDRKWRLELEIEWEDTKQTTGAISIVELSPHYGD